MASILEDLTKTSATLERDRLLKAWHAARDWLSTEKATDSHWAGELSASALSTATAISALQQATTADPELETAATVEAIQNGCEWLTAQQNADGGFGDTDRSYSNIATTFLVVAAWKMTSFADSAEKQTSRALDFVEAKQSWTGLRKRYGKDKTFVVPILSNCALAGMVPWSQVPPLPFEAAWLPQDWYRLARMPVVSYAIPALVAIGQARFHFAPPKNPLVRWLRQRAVRPTLDVLRRMQPASGGYLEATPLTSFVLMNLAATGHVQLPVARECLKFLLDSRLPDGSWPIDTNLATWVTSLSIGAHSRRTGKIRINTPESSATAESPRNPVVDSSEPNSSETESVFFEAATVRWLLRCQHKSRHPFTGANPGGWGWTDLSGAVPDADDTPAALIALARCDLRHPRHARLQHEVLIAVESGLQWLVRLQNRDGGWPTFCRGWGKLPFDRSGTDLTAHAIRAIVAWSPRLHEVELAVQRTKHHRKRLSSQALRDCVRRGMQFLSRHQQADGCWLPLWFGNQDRSEEDNPIYGTGKVLLAYAELGEEDRTEAQEGMKYLVASQNSDGGWGGGQSVRYPTPNERLASENEGKVTFFSTIEETSVALEACLACGGDPERNPSIMRGLEWLTLAVESGQLDHAWPIGFYFAKLWYYERLYPALFALSALGSALNSEHFGNGMVRSQAKPMGCSSV